MSVLFRILANAISTVILLSTLLAIAVSMVAVASLETAPRVMFNDHLNVSEVARVKKLLAEHDPRRQVEGKERELILTSDDLALLLNEALQHAQGGARFRVDQGMLALQATASVPANPIGQYLNLAIQLRESKALPIIEALQLGQLNIPGPVANMAWRLLIDNFCERYNIPDPATSILGIAFTPQKIHVRYRWQAALINAIRAQVISQEDEVRMQVYQARMVEVLGHDKKSILMPQLLAPLFERAAARSKVGDAVAENRALILVVAAYVTGHSLDALVPSAVHWPESARGVGIYRRHDLVQHFANSAALAATTNTQFAEAVGTFKEEDDAKYTSGFSFVDLLADEAGTQVGRHAVESVESALALQRAAQLALHENEWIPSIKDLPENLTQAEFEQRFDAVGSAKYNTLMAEIHRRVTELNVLK